MFDDVSNFRVGGGGTFNGNGKKWWQMSCKVNNNHVSHWTCLSSNFHLYCSLLLWLWFLNNDIHFFPLLPWFTAMQRRTKTKSKRNNILHTIKFYKEQDAGSSVSLTIFYFSLKLFVAYRPWLSLNVTIWKWQIWDSRMHNKCMYPLRDALMLLCRISS